MASGATGKFLDTGWGTLASVVLGTFIIGYAICRKHQLEHVLEGAANSNVIIDNADARISELKAPGYLTIQTGVGAEYNLRTPSQGGGIVHVIRVKVSNTSGKIAADARLSIINLNPQSAGSRDFFLCDITLPDGEDRYINVASHAEGVESARNLMRLQIPYPAGYYAPHDFGILSGEHRFQLRLVQNEKRLAEIYCRLYVDALNVMQLERLDDRETQNGH